MQMKYDEYEVIRLIKENNYCETYRVEDEKGEPFFLKLFILKNIPEKRTIITMLHALIICLNCVTRILFHTLRQITKKLWQIAYEH